MEDDVAVDRWSKDRRRRKVYYLNKTYLMETDAPEPRDGSQGVEVAADPQ